MHDIDYENYMYRYGGQLRDIHSPSITTYETIRTIIVLILVKDSNISLMSKLFVDNLVQYMGVY